MHKSKGCEWTGELREFDNHLNSDPPADHDKALQGCPYTLINCPLGCAGCEKGVCRKDVKSHVNDRFLSHIMMQNSQMRSFKLQLQEYRSQLQEYCSINRQLKTQLEEVKRDKEHLGERMARLEAKNSKLDVANHHTPGYLGTRITGTVKPIGANFTMTDFEEYKRDNDSWFSPHFYTHLNGYKMCLRINANGAGSGLGTHLSVVVHLLQGEFDDQLKWPFQGDISVKLVNQEEDRDHVIRAIDFGKAPSQYCKRVMTKERVKDGWGWGFCDFLPHAALQPKYLKNDCIKLCVKKIEF
jgi:TNF receptor-associated factor 4